MKKITYNLFKDIFPLLVVVTIIAVYLCQIEYATYGGYTFNMFSKGNELKIVSGLDHVGVTIEIKEGTIQFNNNEYSYIVTNKKGNIYNIDFVKPEEEAFSINQHNGSFVRYHNRNKAISHSGNSSSTNSDNRRLLASALLVHLSVLDLYSKMTIYFIALAIFVALGYFIYLRPNCIYNVYRKIRKRNYQDTIILRGDTKWL